MINKTYIKVKNTKKIIKIRNSQILADKLKENKTKREAFGTVKITFKAISVLLQCLLHSISIFSFKNLRLLKISNLWILSFIGFLSSKNNLINLLNRFSSRILKREGNSAQTCMFKKKMKMMNIIQIISKSNCGKKRKIKWLKLYFQKQ